MAYQNAWGLKYEEVQGLCWLAYRGNGIKNATCSFSNAGSIWRVVEAFEVGGFRAVLVKSGEKTVLSFSGTDMTQIEDWLNNVQQGIQGASPYYGYALYYASRYSPDFIVGHSLGGGLASYCSVYLGKLSATINPAPLNINLASGIGMMTNNGKVINYVATGEALDILDTVAPNMRRVGQIIYVGSGGGDPVSKHLLNNLTGFTAPVKIR